MTHFPPLETILQQLRDGHLTARALVEMAETNHQKDDLSAYKTWAGSRAAAAAIHVDGLLKAGYDAGPLMGLPVSVKDLFGVPNLPVFAGTDTDFGTDWQQPGPVVQRLLGQLGIVMGKTHTVEMAFGGLGMNMHWPVPRNPWGGGGRIPGGSSSGAGVSLIEGSAVVALGTDTAGSVRIPASVTGNVGLKTTKGRWSINGIVPLSPSFDTPGLLCRTVADLRHAFLALDPDADGIDTDIPLSGLRIGVLGGTVADGVDGDVAGAVETALRAIGRGGARITDATLSQPDPALDLFRNGGLAAPELAAFLAQSYPDRIARLDPVVRARVDGAADLSAVDYIRRIAAFDRMARITAAEFADFDLLACATVAISPPEITSLATPGAYAAANMAVLRNTAVANLLGLCALTMPVGLDRHGMPVGLMLMAPAWQEERLIAASLAIEKSLGTGSELLGRP